MKEREMREEGETEGKRAATVLDMRRLKSVHFWSCGPGVRIEARFSIRETHSQPQRRRHTDDIAIKKESSIAEESEGKTTRARRSGNNNRR